MTNSEKLLEFLQENKGPYCDDCLSYKLAIEPRQQVRHLCAVLSRNKNIIRAAGICSACAKNKLVNEAAISVALSKVGAGVFIEKQDFNKAATKMDFKNEEDFRRWLVDEVSIFLGNKWIVLQGKNVSDIVIFNNESDRPSMLFVEVKYHKSSHGRIGFGNSNGEGYQVEILMRRPLYLEKNLRWLIANQDLGQCLFLTNDDIRNNAAGEIAKGKQNNLSSGLFESNKDKLLNFTGAVKVIVNWAKDIDDAN